MLAQTMRLRILFTGASGLLSTIGPVGRVAGRVEAGAAGGGAVVGDAGVEAPAPPPGRGMVLSC
jgi:hypothetical protein